jgi:hypothetical protein
VNSLRNACKIRRVSHQLSRRHRGVCTTHQAVKGYSKHELVDILGVFFSCHAFDLVSIWAIRPYVCPPMRPLHSRFLFDLAIHSGEARISKKSTVSFWPVFQPPNYQSIGDPVACVGRISSGRCLWSTCTHAYAPPPLWQAASSWRLWQSAHTVRASKCWRVLTT